MRLTTSTLSRAMVIPRSRAEAWLPHIQAACDYASINSRARMAAFMAQVGHESGSLQYTRELWGPTKAQDQYDTRVDLGNTPERDGDGFLYRGRGLIQLTGRFNYQALTDALGFDFVSNPGALEQPRWAALSAGWFWKTRNLNPLADRGLFKSLTIRINGGLNGYQDRLRRHQIAWEALG